MRLCREAAVLTYDKDQFRVSYHYFLCPDSGEHFTDDELDGLNLIQAYQQYCQKYGIRLPNG